MDLKLSSFIFSLVIFAVVSLAFINFINDLVSVEEYNATSIDTSAFNRSIQLSEDLNKSASEMKDLIAEAGSSTTGFFIAAPQIPLQVAKMIFSFLKYVPAIFSELGEAIGIPGWLLAIAISATIIAVVLAFVALIARYKDT